MEIARVVTARALRLFDIEELNPRGRNLWPLITAITERYKFLHSPVKPEEFDIGKGIKFYDGSFRVRDIDIQVSLEIYRDGIVANTASSTADSEALIDDLLQWAGELYGLGNANYILKEKRGFLSELIIFAPKLKLNSLCDQLKGLAGDLASADSGPVELTGFTIGGDDPKSRRLFTIERRAGTPFDDHKYYTTSTLPTNQHWAALERLEDLFGA